MAKIAVYDINRNQVAERELVDAVFNTEVKEYLIHDMVRYQLAARRQGTPRPRGAVRSGVAAGSLTSRKAPATPARGAVVHPTTWGGARCSADAAQLRVQAEPQGEKSRSQVGAVGAVP